ncbi:sulfite exporter TauE/SafE family protein [Pontimicrobium sp. SW4]|uniref:Probable membrane transporter protein n=1 Tax=Pontimicrobium sp. SW4 TaxID=3153519 RepID=A0AAU7BPL9_9FLAO
MELQVLFIICLGVFLGFFIQTIIGFAGALVALPILLLVIGLPDAIAYISIFYLCSSIYLISKEWENIDRKIIIRLAIASIFGIALGIWVLSHGKPLYLKKGLGIFILIYVVYTMYSNMKICNQSKFEFIFGFFGGFFSGLFSVGGPLYVIIVKNTAIDIKTFRATMLGIIGFVTLVRVPILCLEGILNFNHLYYSLYIFPFFILAVYLGKRMYLKLNESILRKGVILLLLLSGFVLTFKS